MHAIIIMIVAIVVAAAAVLGLTLHISGFRKDTRQQRDEPWLMWTSPVAVLSPRTYTERGKRLLPWLWTSEALLAAAVLWLVCTW